MCTNSISFMTSLFISMFELAFSPCGDVDMAEFFFSGTPESSFWVLLHRLLMLPAVPLHDLFECLVPHLIEFIHCYNGARSGKGAEGDPLTGPVVEISDATTANQARCPVGVHDEVLRHLHQLLLFCLLALSHDDLRPVDLLSPHCFIVSEPSLDCLEG